MSRAENYMMRYRDSLEEIYRLETDLRIMEGQLQRITPSYSDDIVVSGGDPLDRRRELQAQYADAKDTLERVKGKSQQYLAEQISMCNRIQNYWQRSILLMYYCNCNTVKEITDTVRYCRAQVYNIRNAGLKEVQRLINQDRRGF